MSHPPDSQPRESFLRFCVRVSCRAFLGWSPLGARTLSESLLVSPSAQHRAGASEIKHELKQCTAGQLSLETYWFLLMVLHSAFSCCGKVLISWETVAICVFLMWRKVCFLMVNLSFPLLFLFISFFFCSCCKPIFGYICLYFCSTL